MRTVRQLPILATRTCTLWMVLLFLMHDGGRAWAQSCTALGGVLGPNEFTAEVNGTFGVGTGANQESRLIDPSVTTFPYLACGSPAEYPPQNGCYAVTTRRTLSASYPTVPNGGFAVWHRHSGHTSGTATDKYLVVNASVEPGIFYRQTVTGIVPGSTYEMALWALNLTDRDLDARILPNLAFEYNRIGIDDDGDGLVDEPGEAVTGFATGPVPETSLPTWLQYQFLFNAGTATSVEFIFRNNAPGGSGNDISLDDLTLKACSLPSTNSVSGTVFSDVDQDGIQDPGERGIGRVTIQLVNQTTGAINTTETDPDGHYTFIDVPAGPQQAETYRITVLASDTDLQGATPTLPNPSTRTISVTPSSVVTGQDFGFTALADLTIVKTDNRTTYFPGGIVTYTITVTNNGPSDVIGAIVTDSFPAAILAPTWTCAPSPGAACPASGSGNLAASVSIPRGGQIVFTATGSIASNAAGTLTNTATVTPPPGVLDPIPGNNSSTDNDTATPVADLAISKFSAPSPFVPGSPLTYRITVSNLGPSDVAGATVADSQALAGFTWTCTGTGGGTCPASGAVPINVTVDLPRGASVVFVATGIAPPPPPTTLLNTAIVTPPPGVLDPAPGNNEASDRNPIGPVADLSVSKRAVPSPYVAGQPFRYEIQVLNSGPSAVAGARVHDTVPAPLAAFTWTCTAAGAAVCRTASGTGPFDILVDLPVFTSVTIVVQGTIPPGTTLPLENAVTVTPPPDVYDPVPGNNQDSSDSTPRPQADLRITKTVTPNPYVAGGPLTYTVVATNDGPGDVIAARVRDALPPPLREFIWTCTNGATGTCGAASGTGDIDTLVDLPVGGSVTFAITGTVPLGTTGPLVNVATVTEPLTITDPVPGNNSSTAITGGTIIADIGVTKTASPLPAVPGQLLTYTIRVANAGPNDATGVHVLDALPLPHRNFSWTCVGEGGSCLTATGTSDIDTFVTLPAGTAVVFTVTGTVPPDATQTVVNTATAQPSGDVVDPDPSNNEDDETVPVTPIANLSVTKSSQPKPFEPGRPLLYTIRVTNAGPSDAIGASLTDPVPPALAGFQWACTPDPGTACAPATGVGAISTIVTIPTGRGLTVHLFGDVPLDHAGPIVNTTTVTPPPGATDPDPGNNTSTDTNLPVPLADIGVLKEVDNATATVGNLVIFTITATNAGPDPATGVIITDRVPPGLALVSATPSAGTFDAVSGAWRIGSMPIGFIATLTLTARVTAAATLINQAIKTGGDQIDPNTTNNSSSATVTAAAVETPVADISVEKRVSGRGLRASEGVSFTILVRNAGPSPATGVVVDDRLPAGLRFVSADPDIGAYDPMTGAWTIGDLPVDGLARMEVRAILEVADPVTNIARKTAMNEVDPDLSNDADGLVINGIYADVQVVKTVDRPQVAAGETVTFTIVVTNNGLAPATGVRVRELLPASLVVLSSSASQGAFVPEAGFWDVGALPSTGPASHATLTITARALAAGAITNTAAIFATDQPDPNPANNSSSISFDVGGADLTVSVDTIEGNPSVVGSPLDMYFAVTNRSEMPASGPITVAVTLPDELMFMPMPQSGWECTFEGQTGFCTTDRSVPTGGTIVAGFWATVSHRLPPGSQIVVTVLAASDTSPADNVLQVPLTGVQEPSSDLTVTQTVTTGAGTATFDVLVTNDGPDSATQVTLVDVLPVGATLEAIVQGGGECSGTRFVACRLPSLAPGASWPITVTLRRPPPAVLEHTVAVGAPLADSRLGNNVSRAVALLIPPPSSTDTDGDGMPDAWEALTGLPVTLADPGGDPDGDGVSNLDEYRLGTHPRGFHRRYFAEGVSNQFINSHFAAMDMSDNGASIVYAFMRDDGATSSELRTVSPHDTMVVDAAQVAGVRGTSFAAMIESDQPLAAARLVNWGASGGHAERGIEQPSTTWYFAEGATGAFDLFYLLGNASATPADVTITYLLESSPRVERQYVVPPHGRLTVWANAVPGLPIDSQGAMVRSSIPIMAERAMYLRPAWTGGHGGAGATSLATSWYFAEGATGRFFDCYILAINPNPVAAEIEARFARSDGQVVTRTYTIPPERRLSIRVDDVDPLLAEADVSTTVTSLNGVGVVAERAMWWPEGAWYEGHASLGSVETSTRWVIPDAEEGGGGGSSTYVLISNPGAAAGAAQVTVRLTDGREFRHQVTLRPSSRMTLPIGTMFPETAGRHYSVLIESLGAPAVPLTVECARYWSADGRPWSSGVSALATPMR